MITVPANCEATILLPSGRAEIIGAGLNGTGTVETEGVSIVISEREPLRHATIWLKPKNYVLGMGCRKGKEFAALSAFVKEELSAQDEIPTAIKNSSKIE